MRREYNFIKSSNVSNLSFNDNFIFVAKHFQLRQLSGKLPLNYTVWALFTLWRQRQFWASKTLPCEDLVPYYPFLTSTYDDTKIFCCCRLSVNELFQISILNQFMPHWFSSNLLDLTKMPSNRKNSSNRACICFPHLMTRISWLEADTRFGFATCMSVSPRASSGVTVIALFLFVFLSSHTFAFTEFDAYFLG